MPLNPHKGESKDEYTSRCIKTEMDSGKPQDQAVAICIVKADEHFSATSSVSDATWSTEAPINVNFAKVSFDYDETLSTDKGMEMAKRAIERGDTVYIISARRDKQGMLKRAEDLGIPASRVYATGSNKAKEEKVKELGIKKHIDNNSDVVKSLPGVGEKFAKVRRVLFNEDFDVETAKKYKEMGFKVYVRSSRKIKRKDNKVWNQLKQANLTEDNLVFGEIQQLDKRFQFDLLMTGEDPVLEMLSVRGRQVNPKKVLKSFPVSSIQEAEMIEERERKLIDLKFATINFFYRYEEIPGIPAAQSGSRTFCKRLMSSNRRYTIEEIRSLSNTHLEEMFANYPGLEPDVFLYRGGFYRQPGTLNTTPYCRHQWTLEISMT